MIFMNCLALSSRVTGPKMRVPICSPCLLISTAALRSKRIELPSGRRIAFAVRTITAWCTSPFLTRPRGSASLTETTMTSPTVAYLRLEPPSTLMHMTRRAPELSATSRLVCIWIMMLLSLLFPVRATRSDGLLLFAPDRGPALEPRNRPMLLDPHRVADVELVLLVVGVVLLRAPNRLLHLRMREAALDADDDGLVLLVAHDDALQHSLRHRCLLTSTWAATRASDARSCGCGRCRDGLRAPARCSRADQSPAGNAG